jgi:hypothetical protein
MKCYVMDSRSDVRDIYLHWVDMVVPMGTFAMCLNPRGQGGQEGGTLYALGIWKASGQGTVQCGRRRNSEFYLVGNASVEDLISTVSFHFHSTTKNIVYLHISLPPWPSQIPTPPTLHLQPTQLLPGLLPLLIYILLAVPSHLLIISRLHFHLRNK